MTNREWAISENGIYSPYEKDDNSFYIEELRETEKKLDEANIKIETLEEDLTYFIKCFIDLGNHEKTFHEAYAKLFELYKGCGYEKYYRQN